MFKLMSVNEVLEDVEVEGYFKMFKIGLLEVIKEM